MKTYTLILLDALLVPVIAPFFIIFFPLSWIALKFVKKQKQDLLIIKFMGAGNLIALADDINLESVHIITSQNNNVSAIRFVPNAKLLLISTNNPFDVIITLSKILLKLLTFEFNRVVNLETESKLAKLFVLCSRANQKLGVSNRHRSFIDKFIYSSYIVPTIQQRVDIFRALISEEFFVKHRQSEYLCMQAQNSFKENLTKKNHLNISIYPSCSDSERLRRLPLRLWFLLIDELLKIKTCSVKIIFPVEDDIQKAAFLERYFDFSEVILLETSYKDFVNSIQNSDLIFSVDSSAVHIAQNYNVPSFVFFGPTSPFSISITDKCYPISLSLMCSPCIYKYFKPPCNGLAPCMNYQEVVFLEAISEPLSLISQEV
jgi:ADP-heptose:LPS heptosyltransferase